MTKQAFDITIVYVYDDEHGEWPTLENLVNDLTDDMLVYAGEHTYSGNGKPVIYLKNRGKAPLKDTP